MLTEQERVGSAAGRYLRSNKDNQPGAAPTRSSRGDPARFIARAGRIAGRAG